MSMFSSWPEWLACVTLIIAVLVGKRFSRWTVGLVFAFLIGAWFVGSGKWFLVPVVIGAVGWLFTLRRPRFWKWTGSCLAITGALTTSMLCWLFPQPVPPPLIGDFLVGTSVIEVPADGDRPSLLAQIWYPSVDSTETHAVSWLPDSGVAPRVPYHRISHSQTHARRDVLAIREPMRFPVVFYEHSWMGHRSENIVQIENLASAGFVVIAVDHPGQAERIRYPDGSVVPGRYTTALDLDSEDGVTEFEAAAERCFRERIANVEHVRLFLMEAHSGVLAGRLNLDRVGVFGFSFGGSTAMRLCAEVPAFVAGANEDGLVLGSELPAGPFLFFDQEMPAWLLAPPSGSEDAGQRIVRKAEERIQEALAQPERERVIIEGSRHLSFSDRIYASPFPRLARVGTRSPAEIHEILSSHLESFFSAALKQVNDLSSGAR